ncbi:MAG: preprotein translocase subunit SecE [Elusimicrobia bacterium]|nr:preprotein translocase subunit SecE [Elusimicrobiota bacterium]
MIEFLKSVIREVRQNITWASRKEVLGFTGVVLVLVFAISFFVFFVDFAISIILGIFV